ncbi:MAG: hypothetical protein R3330_18025, partial [Saprospiraceae bacterium]|nr:hypothetical protein [Saprospiraceae bacterium]
MIWQSSLSTCAFTWWEHLIWTLIPFLLGVLLGYLLWYRYRHRIDILRSELDALREEHRNMQAQVDQSTDPVPDLEARIARLESDLASSRLAYSTLQNRHANLQKITQQSPPVASPAPQITRKDPLTRIEGIGPKTQ